jgi:cyclase
MPQGVGGNERVTFGFSRREFVALGAAGAMATVLPGRARGAVSGTPLTYFRSIPLGKPPKGPLSPGGTRSDVNAIMGQGGNTLVVARSGSSLLVDTKNAPFGRLLATREANAVGANFDGGANRLVINTHHHADHTGGNWAFTGQVPVLAHHAAKDRVMAQLQRYKDAAANTVRTMEASDRPMDKQFGLPAAQAYLEVADGLTAKDFEPTRLVREDLEHVKVGEIEVEVRHFGPGHTDNDLVVRLPQYNVIHTGDLLFYKRWPFIDLGAGATTEGWIKSVEAIIGLCDDETIVVPGHGEITNVSGLREQAEFFRVVREAVGAAIKDGATRDAAAELPMAAYDGYESPERRPMTLRAVYDELAGAGKK